MADGNDRAIVLFSGGQDSTTCLAWALDRFQHVETVAFDYRQRHGIELACRLEVLAEVHRLFPAWSARLAEDHLVDLGVLNDLSDTALTRDQQIRLSEKGLPTTFVPGRNILFLTLAAAIAYRTGARHVVGGMCETDFSGYPDCRDDTVKAVQLALNLGMDTRFVVHTPLMWLDKASTWRLAEQLGGAALIELIRERTHTCYLGDRTRRHDWGRGCGECPACRLRAEGWERYRTGPAGATEHRPRRGSTPQERNEKCSRADAPANGFATKSTRPLDDR
jgi:7-cyano-7-deazaguanine synthase